MRSPEILGLYLERFPRYEPSKLKNAIVHFCINSVFSFKMPLYNTDVRGLWRMFVGGLGLGIGLGLSETGLGLF